MRLERTAPTRNYGHAATAMGMSPPKEADIEAATNRIGMLTKRADELRGQLNALANRLYGEEPSAPDAEVAMLARAGAVGELHRAIADLDSVLDGVDHEIGRLGGLA